MVKRLMKLFPSNPTPPAAWVTEDGMLHAETAAQRERAATPAFLIALSMYRFACEKRLPRNTQLARLNKSLEEAKDEVHGPSVGART